MIFLDISHNADHTQNLVGCSLPRCLPKPNISWTVIHNFLNNVVSRERERQTDRQTNKQTNENISSLTELIVYENEILITFGNDIG